MADQPTPEDDSLHGASSTSSDAVNSPFANGGAALMQNSNRGNKSEPLSHPTAASNSRQGGGTQAAMKHVHKPTGYTWEKDEDAPGFSWRNKKAQEEMARAVDLIVDKDRIIGRKYGDIGGDHFSQQ